MRTYEVIQADISSAMEMSDTAALKRLAEEMQTIGSPLAMATAHRSRGTAFIMMGDDKGALNEYARSLEIYREIGSLENVARVLGNMGNVYTAIGAFPEALEHYQQALQISEDLEDPTGIATVTGNMGNVYQYTGSYPSALEHYRRALEAHEQQGSLYGVATVTSNMGNVYSITGAHDEALACYERAHTLHEQIGDRDGASIATCNMGNVHSILKDYPKAIEHFKSALAVQKELGHTSGIALVTGNMIAALLDQQHDDEASVLLDEQSHMPLNDPAVRALFYQNMARLKEHAHDLEGAHAHLLKALDVAVEAGIRDGEAEIQRRLRDLAQKRTDFSGYIEHNSEYQRITEEIKGRESTQQMAMMEAERRMAEERRQRDRERAILYSTLPKDIADRVVRGENVTGDHFDNACVIFLDIVDFTSIAESMEPGQVVHFLDDVFSKLDVIVERHGITKIKTIGDSYMAVAFEEQPNNRTTEQPISSCQERAANAALEMLHAVSHIVSPTSSPESFPVSVRIGIHSGTLTAGIIGTERLQYDVWGDTVNVASRMESTGEPGRIHVSEAFATFLGLRPRNDSSSAVDVDGGVVIPNKVRNDVPRTWHLARRGEIDIKGKGTMTTYWLESV